MKKQIFIVAISLLILFSLGIIFYFYNIKEGATSGAKLAIPFNGIPFGYYRTGDNLMSSIPYGYYIDPNNDSNILPIINSGIFNNIKLPTLVKELTSMITQANISGVNDIPTIYILNNLVKNLQPTDKISWTDYSKAAYYKIYTETSGKMAAQITDTSTTQIDGTKTTSARYDSNNYTVQYHADPSTFSDPNLSDATGAAIVEDQYGNQVALAPLGMKSDISQINYYQPGTYMYGGSSYVPNYEDSVYLSKLTNQMSMAPVLNSASISGGICARYKIDPDRLENECNKITGNVCASTSCCVLLGGSKCVSGDEKGPTMKSNYGDTMIKNRDYYYYQGKCYGNCPPY
jgi:hypothetical protein